MKKPKPKVEVVIRGCLLKVDPAFASECEAAEKRMMREDLAKNRAD
jgi:hypothetical protein